MQFYGIKLKYITNLQRVASGTKNIYSIGSFSKQNYVFLFQNLC